MIIGRPLPFQAALDALKKKQAVSTSLKAADLERIDAEIRRAATLLAQVDNAHTAQRFVDLATKLLGDHPSGAGQYMNRARARQEMTRYLQSIGYAPETGKAGSIEDLLSEGRQNLILDTMTQMSGNAGQFAQGNTEKVLDAFPAQELFRLEAKLKERPWPSKWSAAGGRFFEGGRMVALKSDPIWMKSLAARGFNRFGNPYPPFDYNSGMRVRDVTREDAVRFGLIDWDTKVEPVKLSIFKDVQAGVGTISPGLQSALLKSLGDGFAFLNGSILGGT